MWPVYVDRKQTTILKAGFAQRVRRAEFPIAAFGGTTRERITEELVKRLRGLLPCTTWEFWYDPHHAIVRLYMWHASFDRVEPGEEIPVDPSIRLLKVDDPELKTAMETVVKGQGRESRPVEPKAETWRDRMIKDPLW